MEEKSNAQAVIDYVSGRLALERVDTEDNQPMVAILPPGYEVKDISHLLPAPQRITGRFAFISLESFTRYVNEFKGDGTIIQLQRSGSAEATIDGNTDNTPAWGQHVADFCVTFSERWALWDGKNKKSFSQKDFAEFIEDNTVDFLSPSGGAMLDIARTLDAEVNSTFKSALKNPANGDVSFAFERTTTAKAGQKGDLDVPLKFTIQVPILEGESPRLVEVRLRYDLKDGAVTFSFDILNRTRLLEEVRRSVYAEIKNATNIDPFLVA